MVGRIAKGEIEDPKGRAPNRAKGSKVDPQHISTPFVERQNLTMRMQMRRFTRLTNGFSKKFENHCHALAIYFVWYNWMRIHKTLRVTPAMAAGLTDKLMDWSDVVHMIDNRQLEAKISRAEKPLGASGA